MVCNAMRLLVRDSIHPFPHLRMLHPAQVVCDTTHRYQMGSYSRAFCQRSHERYTLCGNHGVEPGCDKTKDWRQCPQCAHAKPRERPDDVADVSCCGGGTGVRLLCGCKRRRPSSVRANPYGRRAGRCPYGRVD